MRKWVHAVALAALLLIGTPVATAQEGAARATIADGAWMAGRWVGEGLGGQIEESWSAPAGGQMVGYFSLLREGRPVFYEIMLLEEHEGGLRLRVKHFNPDFIGWEEKDRWVAFNFISASPGALRFESLSLESVGETEMIGRIRIRYTETDVREEVLRYRRAPL